MVDRGRGALLIAERGLDKQENNATSGAGKKVTGDV
jgi:hypothetical protein